MTRTTGEYDRGGRVGLGVPQANPTVEPEFRRLLPEDVAYHVVRLYADEPDPTRRLPRYLDELALTLERFDELVPEAFGFAMTGSAYLLGLAAEERLVHGLGDRFGYPVITATAAIDSELRAVSARRIVLISPYPAFLVEAAERYWFTRGYQVDRIIDIARPVASIRGIYALGPEAAAAALAQVRDDEADAIVLSGTGLPTLSVLDRASDLTGLPVIGSNQALAHALLAALPRGGPEDDPAGV